MKYDFQIGDHHSSLDAKNDRAAVDKARASHDVPDHGGNFEIVVRTAEPSDDVQGNPRPVGLEISRFWVRHEPSEEKRTELEAAAVLAAQQADRDRLKAELRAEIEAENAAKITSGI